MSSLGDIKTLIEEIFIKEGIKKEFINASSMKGIIENDYLTPEFRPWEEFTEEEKGNVLPPGLEPEGRERDRRKAWTGKNTESSLSPEEKKSLKELKTARTISYALLIAAGASTIGGGGIAAPAVATHSNAVIQLTKKIRALEGAVAIKNQLDRFLLISDDTLQLNGFLNKNDVNSNLKSLLLKYFYERLLKDASLKRLLIFLTALFSAEIDDISIYTPYITLDGLFLSYFNNSHSSLESFFKSIEVDEDKKRMYRSIGYSNPGVQAKNHIPVLGLIPTDISSGYYEQGDTLSSYISDGLEKIIEEQELPLIDPNGEYFRKYFDNDFANNLASTLAKQYGDDDEIKALYGNFLKLIGYTQEEVDRFLYLFVFPELDFSECSPEPEIVEEVPEDESTPEDSYEPIPPDWTTMESEKIYYNESELSYALSFVTNYETTTDKNIEDIKKEYKNQITEEMLRLLNKDYDQSEFDKMVSKLNIKSYYINPTPLLKIKLLAYLHKTDVNSLEDTVDAPSEVEETLIYNIKDLFGNLEFFVNLMKTYEQRLIVDLLRGNSLYYVGLNFSQEANFVSEFSDNLNQLIKSNIKNSDPFDFIQISFVGTSITSAVLTRDGYKNKKIISGLKSFSSSSPQTRERTINFVKNINIIVETINEKTDLKYSEFINLFFNPRPIVKETKNTLQSYSSGISQPNKLASLEEVGKRSLDALASEVKRGYVQFSCLTEDQKKELDKKIDDDENLEKKEKFGEQFQVAFEDRFFNEVPDVFKKISKEGGKKAVDALGKELLSRLGLCGLGDLASLASNSLFAFLNPQEYNDEMIKCAISKLDPETARKFYNKVKGAQILASAEQGTGFLETYRTLVGDTLLPWDATVPTGRRNVPESEANLLANLPGDYDLRIRAFADAITLSFDTTQLLQLFSSIQGGEWIKYFIEISDSIIRECKIIGGEGVLTTVNPKATGQAFNFCSDEKAKIKWPKLPKIPKTKSSTIADAIADNAKEIIINLAIKLIIAAFKTLLKSVAATLSGDANSLKQGKTIPDFFQDGTYFYRVIRESSEKASITEEEINESVLETLQELQIVNGDEISADSVGKFISNTSIVVGERQKIDLLKGESSRSTKKDILEANQSNNLGEILAKDSSKIDDLFSAIGQNVNLQKQEDNLTDQIENANVSSIFCFEDDDPFSSALKENKGIGEEEAEEQKKEKLEREKEKLCNYMDMISSPIAPIFGKAFQKVLGKDGPIYGTLEAEKFNIFKDSLKKSYALMANPFSADLYDPKTGLLELILHSDDGYGYTRSDSKGDPIAGDALETISSNIRDGTNFVYQPVISDGEEKKLSYEKEFNIYSFGFTAIGGTSGGTGKAGITETLSSGASTGGERKLRLEEYSNGNIKIYIGPQLIVEYTLKQNLVSQTSILPPYLIWPPPPDYSRSASRMYEILLENLNISNEDFDKESIASDIIENNFTWLIEKYYSYVQGAMLDSASFTFNDWKNIYPKFTQSKIQKLLGIDDIIEKSSFLYQRMDIDPRVVETKKDLFYESPFDMVLSKEDSVSVSILTELMVRTYALEFMLKSFFTFRAFSEKFFEKQDIISNYIIREMKKDLGDNYNFFVNLAMQLYLQKINLGITDFNNPDTSESYSKLSENLVNFRFEQRTDIDNFLNDNSKSITALMSDFSEDIISQTIASFRDVFSSFLVVLDQFILGPLLQNRAYDVVDTIIDANPDLPQHAIFKSSTASDYKKTNIILEKYIIIEDKENVPDSVSSIVKNRSEELFGVVNLNSWKTYLDANKDSFESYQIGDLWKSWKFGIRLSYVMPPFINSDSGVTREERQRDKAYRISIRVSSGGLSYTLIPLVKAEIEINEQKIIPGVVNQFDLSCLIYDLSKKEEYKKLFTDAIDIETLISLLTIYSVDNFVPLLGEAGNPSSDLDEWNKNPQTFQNMKNTILELLEDF